MEGSEFRHGYFTGISFLNPQDVDTLSLGLFDLDMEDCFPGVSDGDAAPYFRSTAGRSSGIFCPAERSLMSCSAQPPNSEEEGSLNICPCADVAVASPTPGLLPVATATATPAPDDSNFQYET